MTCISKYLLVPLGLVSFAGLIGWMSYLGVFRNPWWFAGSAIVAGIATGIAGAWLNGKFDGTGKR